MGLITNYNLRSMVVRKGTAAMTAMGIAMVVAVFVMTLAIAQGFRATLVASGSPQNAIVLRKGATSETVERGAESQLPMIKALPQIARGADGSRSRRPSSSSSSRCRGGSDNQPANVPCAASGRRRLRCAKR